MIRAASRLQRLGRLVPVGSTSRQFILKADVLQPPLVVHVHNRTMSAASDVDSPGTNPSTSTSSVDETLDKLFKESNNANTSVATDAWFDAANNALWEPTWYNLADQVIVSIRTLHEFTGLEYGWAIIGATAILRIGLFPLMVQTQRTTSRMSHLQPEIELMKKRYEAIGTPSRQDQLQFSKKLQTLFKKYEVQPLMAFAAPFVQLPLFMSMFFGLQKIIKIAPFDEELKTSGLFWFKDLTACDPLYILPVASTATFVLLIEMTKDQMSAQNKETGQIMASVFRLLSLAMFPVCTTFPAAILCYWTTNNVLTLLQTAVLKSDRGRRMFGIWAPPKPVPGSAEPDSLVEAASKLAQRVQGKPTSEAQRIKVHNKAVEARNRAASLSKPTRGRRRGVTGTRNR